MSTKRLAHEVLRTLTPRSDRRIGGRLIYYHSVDPEMPRSTDPGLFDAHLDELVALELDFVTQAEAVTRAKSGDRGWIAIGFDDGYEDNHRIVLPALQKRGIKATFYVVAGQIGAVGRYPEVGYHFYEGCRMLAKSQVYELAAEGHEIASHGLQHELATTVLKQGRDLERELRLSRDLLGEYSSQTVVSHSYPNGQRGAFSPETKLAVRRAGFESSATTLWGRVDKRSDPWFLPRCEISQLDAVAVLRDKMRGGHDYRAVAHRLRRQPTWD